MSLCTAIRRRRRRAGSWFWDAAWDGRNTLEAAIHLFENIDRLRSNMRPEARIRA
jgi:hypothetical protein